MNTSMNVPMNATMQTATNAPVEPSRALNRAASIWYLVTAAGMWLFVYYIVGFYYAPTLTGDFGAWNANPMLPNPYLPDNTPWNLMFAAHVLLAAVLTLGGTIQLVPHLRRHALRLHRWNGRVFMISALAMAGGGLGMNILRLIDDGGRWPSAVDINGLLILICVGAAWTSARREHVEAHRKWALRAFIVVSGVWFLRLGVSTWIIGSAWVNGEPRFVDEFFEIWKWGSFLLPLAVLELYLRTQDNGSRLARVLMAALLVVCAVVTAIGVFAAYRVFWAPLL